MLLHNVPIQLPRLLLPRLLLPVLVLQQRNHSHPHYCPPHPVSDSTDEPLSTPQVAQPLHQASTTLAQLQEAAGALELPGWLAVVGTLGDACRAQQPWVSKLEVGGGSTAVGGRLPGIE